MVRAGRGGLRTRTSGRIRGAARAYEFLVSGRRVASGGNGGTGCRDRSGGAGGDRSRGGLRGGTAGEGGAGAWAEIDRGDGGDSDQRSARGAAGPGPGGLRKHRPAVDRGASRPAEGRAGAFAGGVGATHGGAGGAVGLRAGRDSGGGAGGRPRPCGATGEGVRGDVRVGVLFPGTAGSSARRRAHYRERAAGGGGTGGATGGGDQRRALPPAGTAPLTGRTDLYQAHRNAGDGGPAAASERGVLPKVGGGNGAAVSGCSGGAAKHAADRRDVRFRPEP